MPKHAPTVPPELEDVANQVGEFIEYFGFKKVHGRIWTHLFLSPVALDATDLVERLSISKALVSMSIADLLTHEVIEISGKGSRGTSCYRANPQVTKVIMNVLRKRERRMLSRVNASIKLLKGVSASKVVASERVESLSTLVTSAEDILDTVLQMGQADFGIFSSFLDIPALKE